MLIDRLDPERTASLRGLARALNEEGVPTPSGEGTWTASTVARLRQRLELS
jgi:Recombinase